MSKALTGALLLAGIACGCALSYRPCHRSPLLVVLASEGRTGRDVAERARFFEDAIVGMADEFGVPLQDVIPVRVFVDGVERRGRSYYNGLTGAIVIRDGAEGRVVLHELSHLFTHRIDGSPPYWIDQALAEYMEERFARVVPRTAADAAEEAEKRRDALRRLSEAKGAPELLAHLTPAAIDEERGWGTLVVRYLLDARWSGRSAPEKIRGLLRLSDADIAMLAPEIIAWSGRPELLAGIPGPRSG